MVLFLKIMLEKVIEDGKEGKCQTKFSWRKDEREGMVSLVNRSSQQVS